MQVVDVAVFDLEYPRSGLSYPVVLNRKLPGRSQLEYVYTVGKMNKMGFGLMPTHLGGSIYSCSIMPDLTANTGLTFDARNCGVYGKPTMVSKVSFRLRHPLQLD
jgi:hypothetical protein